MSNLTVNGSSFKPSKLSIFCLWMHYFSIEHCLFMLTGTAECTVVDAFNHGGENIGLVWFVSQDTIFEKNI